MNLKTKVFKKSLNTLNRNLEKAKIRKSEHQSKIINANKDGRNKIKGNLI